MNNYVEEVLFNDDLLNMIAYKLNCGRSKLNQVCRSMCLPLNEITTKLKQTKNHTVLKYWNIETNILYPSFKILTGVVEFSSNKDLYVRTSPIQWVYKGLARTYNTTYLLGQPNPCYIQDKITRNNLKLCRLVLRTWYNRTKCA